MQTTEHPLPSPDLSEQEKNRAYFVKYLITQGRTLNNLDAQRQSTLSELITDREKIVAFTAQKFLAAGASLMYQQNHPTMPNGSNLAYRLYGENVASFGLQRAAHCGQTYGEYYNERIQNKHSESIDVDEDLIAHVVLYPLVLADSHSPGDERYKEKVTAHVIEYFAHSMGYLPPDEFINPENIGRVWTNTNCIKPIPSGTTKRLRFSQRVDNTVMDLLACYKAPGIFYPFGVQIWFG